MERIAVSEPPTQIITYAKYAPICVSGSFLFFLYKS